VGCAFEPRRAHSPVKSDFTTPGIYKPPFRYAFLPMKTTTTYLGSDGRWLVIPKPSLRSVREHFWNFACTDLVLNGAPEIGAKNLAMMLEQRSQGRLWEG